MNLQLKNTSTLKRYTAPVHNVSRHYLNAMQINEWKRIQWLTRVDFYVPERTINQAKITVHTGFSNKFSWTNSQDHANRTKFTVKIVFINITCFNWNHNKWANNKEPWKTLLVTHVTNLTYMLLYEVLTQGRRGLIWTFHIQGWLAQCFIIK